MKKNITIMIIALLTTTSLFFGCISLSITGERTNINTLRGDSIQGIILVEYDSKKIILAKDPQNGTYSIFANVLTYKNNTIGSLILYIDGEKNNIMNYPEDWKISDVKIQSMGPTVKEWRGNNKISKKIISKLKSCMNLKLRVINGSLGLSYSDLDNVDLTSILPKIEIVSFLFHQS